MMQENSSVLKTTTMCLLDLSQSMSVKLYKVYCFLVCLLLLGVSGFIGERLFKDNNPQWFIRVNAIRNLLGHSKNSGYAVTGENLDLVAWGEADLQSIEQLILELYVEKNEVTDERGFSVSEYWMKNIPDERVPKTFAKGSILIEDLVRFNPEFFIVLIYSVKSNNYLIMINNAKKILSRV